MRRAIFIFVFLHSLVWGGEIVSHPSELKPKPLEISIPTCERMEPKNFIKTMNYPLYINITTKVRTGSKYDPSDKVGLAKLTGSVMRVRGTAFMSG